MAKETNKKNVDNLQTCQIVNFLAIAVHILWNTCNRWYGFIVLFFTPETASVNKEITLKIYVKHIFAICHISRMFYYIKELFRQAVLTFTLYKVTRVDKCFNKYFS